MGCTNQRSTLRRIILITGIGFASTPAITSAMNFNLGPIDGSFDSTLSAGASWRMADIDPQNASPGNLTGGQALSSTNDDGTLNFKKNKTFSKIIKGVHELQLSHGRTGIFTRFNYWYDKELADESRPHGHSPNNYQTNTQLDDGNFSNSSKFSGINLLDAFVYSGFEVGSVPVDVRLGKQVVSWGESTFIQNGINTINPIDVAALRRPGAELKEGLIPVNILYSSLGLTEALSLEMFYQLEWDKTQIDACGTYFSNSDVVGDGCNALTLSNQIPDATLASMPVPQGQGALLRTGDREPDDQGQLGLSLRYYAQELNDTEFGFYYLNYHSRVPLLNVTTKGGIPNYFIGYPEDIQLYGVSFNTNAGLWAVSGEISHRIDMPVQINGSEVIGGLFGALGEGPATTFTPRITPGEDAYGWDHFDVSQAQITLVRAFNRVAGANRLTLVGEAGFSHIHGSLDDHPYGRNTNYGTGAPGDDGFVTDNAWGYRLRASLEYMNAFSGINLKPVMSFGHDVNGVSPTGGSFNEGNKTIGFSLNADYQSRYQASLSYTNFFGGDFNTHEDRDFASVSVSVGF